MPFIVIDYRIDIKCCKYKEIFCYNVIKKYVLNLVINTKRNFGCIVFQGEVWYTEKGIECEIKEGCIYENCGIGDRIFV